MEVARIAAIGIIAGVLAVTIKKTNPELAVQMSVAAGVLMLLMLMNYLTQAVEFIRDFAERMNGAYAGVTVVLKVVGIAYLCEFAVNALRDAGESAIASKVELGGKLIIMVLTLPLLADFVELVLSLAEG